LALTTDIGHIAMTTNLAAAASAVTVMFLSWARYKKPDVSMTLNGALAGLVAITAGCAAVSLWGAIAIGVIAGFTVLFGVELVERVLKIDDPVGAIAVHGLSGAIGTLCVGIFAVAAAPAGISGLIDGGGFGQLGVQALGVVAVMAWTLGTAFILFTVIKKTMGLRVTEEEEIKGLDIGEHASEAYADFVIKM